MKYLKQFVIGSSLLVFAPFFYGFYNLNVKGYSYFNYTFLAPFVFGLWNVISLILAEHLDLSIRYRFLLISVISYLCAIMLTSYLNIYNFTTNQWYQYYLLMLVTYLFIWNVVIYQIEKRIS